MTAWDIPADADRADVRATLERCAEDEAWRHERGIVRIGAVQRDRAGCWAWDGDLELAPFVHTGRPRRKDEAVAGLRVAVKDYLCGVGPGE